MTRINDAPPYAEEQKQLVNEEQKIEQIEEMLSQFEQPIPNGFIPIEAEHICSTKPTWEGKPLSERYGFTHEGKWIWIDIPHELMDKMELEKGEDIKQNLYLDPKVLKNRKETYKGITIQEGEIFLQQSFAIQNLEKDINKLLDKIKELEKEKEENQKIVAGLEKEIKEVKINKKSRESEWLKEKQKNKQARNEINDLKLQIEELEKWTTQFQNQTPEQVQEKINNLIQERDNRPNITISQLHSCYTPGYLYSKRMNWWDKWEKEKKTVFDTTGGSDNYYTAKFEGTIKYFVDDSGGFARYIDFNFSRDVVVGAKHPVVFIRAIKHLICKHYEGW